MWEWSESVEQKERERERQLMELPSVNRLVEVTEKLSMN